MDYKNAGVDIEAGYRSVELMKKHVKETMRPEVLGGLGGFSGAQVLQIVISVDIYGVELVAVDIVCRVVEKVVQLFVVYFGAVSPDYKYIFSGVCSARHCANVLGGVGYVVHL